MANSVVTSLGGLPLSLPLLSRDHDAIVAASFDIIRKLCPDWTDFYPADPGVTLVENTAVIADMLHYYADRVQNESYLPTVQDRVAAAQLLRLIGYTLKPPFSAVVDLTIVTSIDPVNLPAGWQVRSKDSGAANEPAIIFELISAATLTPAGSHTLSFVHGESITLEPIGVSDGLPDQTYALARSPVSFVSDGSAPLQVYVDNILWTQVSSFLYSTPSSQHFRVLIAGDDTVSIQFGDGVNGAIPAPGVNVACTYRVGGGAVGNSVGIGKLSDIVTATPGVDSVTNAARPSGGSDRETVDSGRKSGPMSLRALDRCVTLEDFETIAKEAAGGAIKAAIAVHDPQCKLKVLLFIATSGSNPIPSGSWYPTLNTGTSLVGQVGRYVAARMVHPTILDVKVPVIANIKLRARVYVLPNFLQSDVRFRVNNALKILFADLGNTFSKGLPLSTVNQTIENVLGVDYLEVAQLSRIPVLSLRTGSPTVFAAATISVAEVYQHCVEHAYEVVWLSATEYKLRSSSLGIMADQAGNELTFTAGAEYTLNHYNYSNDPGVADIRPQIKFTVTCGTPPSKDNVWAFSTSYYSGNINPDPYEVLVVAPDNSGVVDPAQVVLTYEGGLA